MIRTINKFKSSFVFRNPIICRYHRKYDKSGGLELLEGFIGHQ